MNFLTITSNNEVYIGLVNINGAVFINLDARTFTRNTTYDGGLKINNNLYNYLTWHPIEVINEESGGMYCCIWKDIVFKAGSLQTLNSYMQELKESVEEVNIIELINGGEFRLRLVDVASKKYYAGVEGWLSIKKLNLGI